MPEIEHPEHPHGSLVEQVHRIFSPAYAEHDTWVLAEEVVKFVQSKTAEQEPFWVVFDGPPAHESGRFVEVENAAGMSVGRGDWEPYDGHEGWWRLGPFYALTPGRDQTDAS